MNALEVIKRDHRRTEEMYEDYKKANHERRDVLEPKIFDALSAHEMMEDKHFYPSVQDALEGDEIFEELEREQTNLKIEVMGIRLLPVGRDEALKSALQKVIAHAKKEEAELFPMVEEALGKEALERLGEEMEPHSAVAKEAEEA